MVSKINASLVIVCGYFDNVHEALIMKKVGVMLFYH